MQVQASKKIDGSGKESVDNGNDVNFEMRVIVTSDITNAEGNMTHYEYARLFSQAVERYVRSVGEGALIQLTSINMSFKYIEDILPGQEIIVKLWVHKQKYKNNIVFMVEFVNAKTAKIHAFGVQEIEVHDEEREQPFPVKDRKSKSIVQFERLKKWIEKSNLTGSCGARYVLTVTKPVCFGRTNYLKLMCSFEYANIFGEVREAFGLKCVPDFKKDIGKKFILITNNANYCITKHFQFGDTVTVHMWVENFSRASFTICAEFCNEKIVYAMGSQRIAYKNLLTGRVSLPSGLRKQLAIITGHSPFSFVTKPVIELLMLLKFLWK